MKRVQMFLTRAFMAVRSLYARSSDAEWQAGIAKLKETIQTDPAQAVEEAEHLIKGKNKKNVELLMAVGDAYLNTDKIPEAQEYIALARKVNGRSTLTSVLEGNIAVKQKGAGLTSQKYGETTYFDPRCTETYLKYADIYKSANTSLAIEKLNQLEGLGPSSIAVDKKLAKIYYLKNDSNKAVKTYANFAMGPTAAEEDLVKYAFALFLNHDFDRSLEVANVELQKNTRHVAFNRLAMYSYTGLKRSDEALETTDVFFKGCDKADYSYLDCMYYRHLLESLKEYGDAVVQYERAVKVDSTKTGLFRNISSTYKQKSDYKKAISAYQKYYISLNKEKQTLDLQFQSGKLYCGAGTQPDSLAITAEERKQALMSADSAFHVITEAVPDSYLGSFWGACANSALNPETTQGLVRPFYEEVAALLESRSDPHYNSALVECYSYLGYYYLLAIESPTSKAEAKANRDKSIGYWSRILTIDPANATTKRALDGTKWWTILVVCRGKRSEG